MSHRPIQIPTTQSRIPKQALPSINLFDRGSKSRAGFFIRHLEKSLESAFNVPYLDNLI